MRRCATSRRPTVVLNVFSEAPADRQAPSTSRDGPVFGLYWFSQTIGPDRGLEDAVAALGLLRDPRVELHLRGRWQDGYEPRLRRLASGCGSGERAIVSHPPASPDAMVSLAADMDIGLALEPPASRNNDILWSNKAFTYLLGGIPVVLSRTTGQRRAGAALRRCGSDVCARRRPRTGRRARAMDAESVGARSRSQPCLAARRRALQLGSGGAALSVDCERGARSRSARNAVAIDVAEPNRLATSRRPDP